MSRSARGSIWYRAVWRWHFYAALLCIPFVFWLAVTGSIYLFKPQIESFLDRPYDNLVVNGPPAQAAAQVAAAVAAVPGSVFSQYELPASPHAAVRVLVKASNVEWRVYVHPQSLKILHKVKEEQRLMRVIFRLHGDFMLGARGSYMVELAASWTIVMILTGLYLWWPRMGNGLGGVVYPRIFLGSRIFWRDLHSVTGVWISFLVLFILFTGLPWAKGWGDYLKNIRNLTGAAVTRQDWSNSHDEGHQQAQAMPEMVMAGEGAQGMGNMQMPKTDYATLNLAVPQVARLHLAPPVLIAPPKTEGRPWTAMSNAQDRPLRSDLTLDPKTGVVISRKDFAQHALIDRIVGYGIAAHEGQLFGWFNQLLGVFAATGLILLNISGVIMWWRRRPDGVLGAPEPGRHPKYAPWFWGLVITLGLILPLMGASLIIILVIERFILARTPKLRHWLGFA